MSEADLTPPAAAGGVNPSFTATGLFPSGLNSSGLVAVPSLLIASTLNASGIIAGTIGQFLATALAGSGFDASGPTLLTTESAQDVKASTLTVSAKASFGGSAVFTSAFSALDIEVSTINGVPPGTTTSTFQSGLTTCALMSVGASVIFTSAFSALDIEVSTINGAAPGTATSTFTSGLTTCALFSAGACAVFNASAVFLSGIDTSGPILGSAASILTVGASTITASALLSAKSILVACTLAVSGAVQGQSGVFASELVSSGQLIVGAPSTVVDVVILVATGQNVANIVVSGVVGGPGLMYQLDASGNVTNTGNLSVGASGTFGSGLNSSGQIMEVAPSTVVDLVMLAATGQNVNHITISGVVGGAGLIFAVDASGNVIANGTVGASAALSTNASALIACDLLVSGFASLGGSAFVACTLAVSGFASFGASVNIANLLSVNATENIASNLLVGGWASVAGSFQVNGTETIGTALSVTTSETVHGNFTASGPALLESSLTVSGLMSAGGSALFSSGAFIKGLGLRNLAFRSIQNGTLSAVSVAVLDYILLGSNVISVLLPSAATVSGKTMVFLTSAGGSCVASIVPATGDNIEGATNLVLTNAAPSFTKAWFYTPGSITWYLVGSAQV